MKALTIYQPWATLIMAGAKPYEFRGWKAPARVVGQTIVIHASARPVRRGEVMDLLERLDDPLVSWTTCLRRSLAEPILLECLSRCASPLPLAAGLGTATLGEPREGWQIAEEFGGHPALLNDSDRKEHSNWGWPMVDVASFPEIVPASGMQGLWEWQGGDVARFVDRL